MIRSSGGIQLKWVKKLRLHPPRASALKHELGAAAFFAIRARVLSFQRLGTGLPTPAYRHGWHIASEEDTRFSAGGSEPTRMVMTENGIRWRKGDPTSRLWPEGYPAAKGKPSQTHSDGSLTGAMWGHGRVTIGTSGKNQVIRVGFGGSQVVPARVRVTTKGTHRSRATGRSKGWRRLTFGASEAGGRTRGQHASGMDAAEFARWRERDRQARLAGEPVEIWIKKATITNQAKADAFQRRKPDGTRTTTPQFALMSLTREEASDLFAAYTRGLRLLP